MVQVSIRWEQQQISFWFMFCDVRSTFKTDIQNKCYLKLLYNHLLNYDVMYGNNKLCQEKYSLEFLNFFCITHSNQWLLLVAEGKSLGTFVSHFLGNRHIWPRKLIQCSNCAVSFSQPFFKKGRIGFPRLVCKTLDYSIL